MFNECRKSSEFLNTKCIFLYGIGVQCYECYIYLAGRSRAEIILVDSDESKWNTIYLLGKGERIIAPIEMLNMWDENSAIVISAINHQYEIAKSIQQLGFPSSKIFSYTSAYYEENIYRPDKIMANKDRISNVYQNLLCDEESKEYYANLVKMRLSRNPLYLKPNPKMKHMGEYDNTVQLKSKDVIIDCGAYTGDTAAMYMEKCGGGCIVHAIEPFKASYDILCDNINKNEWTGRVIPYNYAVSSERGHVKIHYEEDGFKMAVSLNALAGANEQEIMNETLDYLFYNQSNINYIKMDIEGEEYQALRGANNLIKKFHPKLMISSYHKAEDLWTLPECIHEINPKYSMFYGHAPGVSMEPEIYCISTM